MNKFLVKAANLTAAGYSFLRSILIHNSGVSCMPVTVSIELTNYCNLRCPECFSGSGMMTRSKGFMEIPLFEKIIRELKPYLFEMSLYFQGESMLHPHFYSFLEKSWGIRTSLATNGHFLTPENAEKLSLSGLKCLIVSLDGMDEDIYSAYRRNGDVNVVINGIKNVSEAITKHCSSMNLVIQFLANRQNEHQIPDVRSFAKSVNASLKLKSMQIINEGDYEKWLPRQKRFRRYELKNGKYIILNKFHDNCSRMWFNPVITWDGKVIPCCFDKNADHIMGNLYEDSFRDIWTGARYRAFRESVLNDRKMNDICRNCTSGLYWIVSA